MVGRHWRKPPGNSQRGDRTVWKMPPDRWLHLERRRHRQRRSCVNHRSPLQSPNWDCSPKPPWSNHKHTPVRRMFQKHSQSRADPRFSRSVEERQAGIRECLFVQLCRCRLVFRYWNPGLELCHRCDTSELWRMSQRTVSFQQKQALVFCSHEAESAGTLESGTRSRARRGVITGVLGSSQCGVS